MEICVSLGAEKESAMLRRDFVRAAVSAGIAPRLLLGQQNSTPLPPPAPVPWTLGLNPKTPLPQVQVVEGIAKTDPRFFTALQLATLTRLCAVLMPAIGDKPGAIEAETPMFLDFLMAGSPAARKSVYSGGLNWLEAEAHRKFGKAFTMLDDDEADEIVKPWLRTWMSDHPPTEVHAGFVCIALDDVRRATVNSKAYTEHPANGAEERASSGLFWSPIEPDIYGPESSGGKAHVLAAPRSAHTMPSYPR
jgi:hypothetical protein